MKLWCVINLEHLNDDEIIGVSFRQPSHFGPTCFYDEREPAEEEIIRLKKKYPHGDFFLFEAVSQVNESTVVVGTFHLDDVAT